MNKEVDGINLYGNSVKINIVDLEFRPSCYGLIIKNRKMVLVKSKNTGKYLFPGGGINLGETMEQGLIREVKEETGLDVKVIEIIDQNDVFFEYTPSKNRFHSIQWFYLCSIDSDQLANDNEVDDAEAEKPRWVEISTLEKEDFNSHGNSFIENFLRKIKKLD